MRTILSLIFLGLLLSLSLATSTYANTIFFQKSTTQTTSGVYPSSGIISQIDSGLGHNERTLCALKFKEDIPFCQTKEAADFSISRNGKKIAVLIKNEISVYDLRVKNEVILFSNKLKQDLYKASSNTFIQDIELSPNATKLLYVVSDPQSDKLFVYDLKTNKKSTIFTTLEGPVSIRRPSFSPDSKKVVFDFHSSGQVRVIDVDSKAISTRPSGDESPRYMPDFSSIFSVVNNESILIDPLNGATDQIINVNIPPEESGIIRHINPSPDGKYFVFDTIDAFNNFYTTEIWRVPVTGGQALNLTPQATASDHHLLHDNAQWIDKNKIPLDSAPQTKITSKPKKTITQTTASFRFKSNQKSSSFKCKLDKGTYQKCKDRRSYFSLSLGYHTFSVRATNAYATVDKTPAKYRFRVNKASSN